MTEFTWKHFVTGVLALLIFMAIIWGAAYLKNRVRNPEVVCLKGYKHIIFNRGLSQLLNDKGNGVKCQPKNF